MKNNDISIIVDDGPISRAYLNFFLKNNYEFANVYYLSNFYLNKKFSVYINFFKSNFHAVRILKNKKFNQLIPQIESFFDFDKGFCEEMYNLNLTKNFNMQFLYSDKIDSIKVIKEIEKKNDLIFINTTKQILKKILKLNHKFIHIHPGYLPYVRGLDGSLWNYILRSKFGVTSFEISHEIDKGNIIMREEFEPKPFNFPNYQSFNSNELRYFWFSIFDPLLRAYHLKNLIKKTDFFSKISFEKNIDVSLGSFYGKIDKNNQSKVFESIFN